MKNKIHKILGVGITLVIAMALVMGFAAPAAASPGETINEWYEFTYPGPGADDGWFYDPSITRVGEITEAIDGTLYVHVRRCVPDATFSVDDGTLTVTEFGTSNTGLVDLQLTGSWNTTDIAPFLPTDIVVFIDIDEHIGSVDSVDGEGTVCLSGTIDATSMSLTGSCEGDSQFVLTDSWDIAGSDEGELIFEDCGTELDPCSYEAKNGSYLRWEWGYQCVRSSTINGLGDAIFKSTDGARTWEETDYPGGWVVDMAASSLDADSLYVADGHYVYKTGDAGDTWTYVKKDSLEEQLAGYCGVPVCCACGHCYGSCYQYEEDYCCPSCSNLHDYPLDCLITSIDVTYDDNDNPYVFIGTRAHCSGIDLDDTINDLECFPGEVYWIGEGGFPSNWSGLGLYCYRNGTYDALAVGCAPDWADSKETYVVVTTDNDDGDGSIGEVGDYQTHVVSTTGGPCDWPEYAELKWDCVTPFASAWASRIAFPDDWEDTGTLFVGVTDCDYCSDCTQNTVWHGCGGDVYMVMDGSALDMNVLGISSGCIGLEAVDINSLDIEGDTEEARLIAGATCCNKVYCSEDGGWSWDASAKDPTGGWTTSVIWYEDTALAATSGCEAAVSMCCGEDYPCEFWNQISLMATGIEKVRSIDHSPGYVCGDSETMFMLTNWDWEEYWDDGLDCCFPCQESRRGGGPPRCYRQTQSVWRHDGTYWERVYSSTIATHDTRSWQIFENLQVSPDFNTTSAVYLWNGCFEMWRTTDAGCSWTKLTFPCAPRPCIRAAVVIDEDTVIAGGWGEDGDCCDDAQGYVYKTTRHGARPWSEYEFDATHEGDVISFALEPGYEDPGSVLLGDDESGVYISEDGGETWDLVGDPSTVFDSEEDTYVIFDPAYATSGIIYAAAGDIIARCIIDPELDWADQVWEVICDRDDGTDATGIQAAGDTALYVTDGESTDDYKGPDTEGPDYCDGSPDGIADEGGVLRSLNPDAEKATDVIFERLAAGLPFQPTFGDKAQLRGLWLTCDTSDEGCAENVLWTLEAEGFGEDDEENIWIWEDTLAAPVVLAMPLDAQKLTTTNSATLSWNALCGADCYEVSLWKYCPECPDEKLAVPLDLDCAPGTCCIACAPEAAEDLCACPAGECVCTSDICIVVDGLESGTEYHWQVRVCLCKPFLSKWSEERTFMTALVQVVHLCSPVCGGQDIILTPNFSWDAVEGATGYDIELAPTETFTAGVVRGSSTVNAWVAPEDLEYATTYYWRVRAEKDGVFSDWTVCIFTTMEKPVAPTPPVTITPAPPAPQINIPPAEMITPNWIYAIIAIGAALCVVVIVLIVRTRRPPA